MRKFIPQLVPTLVTVPSFILVICLGIWQIERLEWKNTMLTRIEQQLAAAPVDLPQIDAPLEKYHYLHVKLTGKFLHEHEIVRQARYHKGMLGANILTPMQLDDGRFILVERGWVSREKQHKEERPESLVVGTQQIEAIISSPLGKGLFVPDNNPDKNAWFWLDIAAISAKTGLNLMPVVAEAIKVQTDGGYPISADGHIEIKNDHLMYAITWFAMALVIVVIYFVYHLQDNKR